MIAVCLIAEADPFIANLLLRYAEESGLSAVRAKTGQEMLVLMHQFQPNILIVDPELPGELRGWEAVRILRAEVENTPPTSNLTSSSTLPIAVISCSWLEKADAHELLGPVVWYLQKPNLYYSDFVKALEAARALVKEHRDWSGQPG